MAEQQLWRVKESFAVPGADYGMMRPYPVGAMVSGDDPIAVTHRHFLEPAANAVEQATAAPGQRRNLVLPSGVTQQQAVQHRTGHAHRTSGDTEMVHTLPPEDVNSPASTFAPSQPGLGVVADDVPDSQNVVGAPKAADVTAEQVEKIAAARKGEEPADPNTETLVSGDTQQVKALQGEDAPVEKSPDQAVEEAAQAKETSEKARGGRNRRQADQEAPAGGKPADGSTPTEADNQAKSADKK